MNLRQNIEAGKTAVATKVQATLTMATLIDGVVIPQGAIFSGEVMESTAKSINMPSHLAIRLDSVEWKAGSKRDTLDLKTKVYLTSWYYPTAVLSSDDSPESTVPASQRGPQHVGGAGTYPDPNRGTTPQVPHGGIDADSNINGKVRDSLPRPPSASMPSSRVVLKNVESSLNPDGSTIIISAHSNIKLDKSTIYVFAPSDEQHREKMPPK